MAEAFCPNPESVPGSFKNRLSTIHKMPPHRTNYPQTKAFCAMIFSKVKSLQKENAPHPNSTRIQNKRRVQMQNGPDEIRVQTPTRKTKNGKNSNQNSKVSLRFCINQLEEKYAQVTLNNYSDKVVNGIATNKIENKRLWNGMPGNDSRNENWQRTKKHGKINPRQLLFEKGSPRIYGRKILLCAKESRNSEKERNGDIHQVPDRNIEKRKFRSRKRTAHAVNRHDHHNGRAPKKIEIGYAHKSPANKRKF